MQRTRALAAGVALASLAAALAYRRLGLRARDRAELQFEDGSTVSLAGSPEADRLAARAREVLAAAAWGALLTDEELRTALVEHAYLEGDFVLRSGARSSYYLDKYRFETRPELLEALGARIAAAVAELDPGATRLAGPELGAVALAAAASLQSRLPFVIVRKQEKSYGTTRRLEGEFEAGERVCVVEDVVTSGGAALQAVEALREAGLECRAAVCVVDREEGGSEALARHEVVLHPLFVSSELVPGSEIAAKPHDWAKFGRHVRVFRRASAPARQRRRGGEVVTKQEFVDRVATKSGLSKRDASKAVDAFLDSVTEALTRGDSVAFTGFGKFSTAQRAARQGVNPRNPSQKVHIPAATVPRFSAGSGLKQALKG
jgi:orotate phosphoribosyltransferase